MFVSFCVPEQGCVSICGCVCTHELLRPGDHEFMNTCYIPMYVHMCVCVGGGGGGGGEAGCIDVA